jgi:CubicO group peptidase (beta-lactamase class C family)
MESGINATSMDYARFGRLYLHGGAWNGKQILSEQWVKESVSPWKEKETEGYYQQENYYPYTLFFKPGRTYYKYGWWGLQRENGLYDFLAIGHRGQFIFVRPEKKIIIVRTGKNWGKINWWPEVFQWISDKL